MSTTRLFDTTPSLNNADSQFVEEGINGISEALAYMKAQRNDFESRLNAININDCFIKAENKMRALQIITPEERALILKGVKVRDQLLNCEYAIQCHETRLNALNKIKKSEPISVTDKQLLLRMSEFKNSFIETYSLLQEESVSENKNKTSL